MVNDKPYIHWKITDETSNAADIDPTYLWGTIIESDKGPIDTPVFITSASQAKRIFNYNLDPFFANGGRYAVIVRAYGISETGYRPAKSTFDFTLDEEFRYAYVDYEYYNDGDDTPKATVKVITSTKDSMHPKVAKPDDTEITTLDVAFSQGRWRECDENGRINYYYEKETTDNQNNTTIEYIQVVFVIDENKYYAITDCEFDDDNHKYILKPVADGATAPASFPEVDDKGNRKIFTKAFNESEVTKTLTVQPFTAEIGDAVIHVESKYPGDFEIPVTVGIDVRQGYRVSIKESEDYTIMLSGATTLKYISQRINERAQNIISTLTAKGKAIESVLTGSTIPAPSDPEDEKGIKKIPLDIVDGDGNVIGSNIDKYIIHLNKLKQKPPVGSVFTYVNPKTFEQESYSFKLAETTTYMADGSNGPWDGELFRIPAEYAVAAHAEALGHLANIKLSGIFCNYGEDKIQKLYVDHVSTTEPEGMNSVEVCKWRELIVGANDNDRTPDDQLGRIFNLYDKAIAFDNQYIMYLTQGLVDTGYVPQANCKLVVDENGNPELDNNGNKQYISFKDAGDVELQYQLLPYQAVQYIAGLRSGLFYGDSIFGGEDKKRIRGIGKLSIAPLIKGENKVFWQPDVYKELNQYGCLTFTEDYGHISLTDGVTTRQSPLEQDEEGVVNIVKYAQHAVHETLQKYIGRNITGDLQTGMEVEVRNVLNVMYTIDKTLIDLPDEGLSAFDVEVVMVPKSDANQILSKVYVYLKLTPVHALRQIEVELTVQ